LRKITILGATGSIGLNTLDVIKQHPNVTAHQQIDRLQTLCLQWSPRYAVMADPQAAEQLSLRLQKLNSKVQVLSGTDGLSFVASLPLVDMVMAAIVGSAGLLPTLAAAKAGKRILLANKEALVMSGQLFMEAVQQHGAELLPIDSEHNALFQCMPINRSEIHHFKTSEVKSDDSAPLAHTLEEMGVSRLLLTASANNCMKSPLHRPVPTQIGRWGVKYR